MVRPRVAAAPRRTPAPGASRPHRELRFAPGTYFSSRSLRSNPSDLEENAVLDHKVRPRHRAQRTPQAPPRQPRTHAPRTRRATCPARRGRAIRPVDRTPRTSPQPQGCVLVARPVMAATPAHVRCSAVRPSAYAPGEVPTLRTRRPLPAPFPGIPEPAAPQPRESPPLWRNVGPTLGSFRRLAVQLPKTLWAIPMGLLDSLSNMWGVRHHDSPPVSEWCS